MPTSILDDGLWQVVEPLLPKIKRGRRPHPGRHPLPMDNRSPAFHGQRLQRDLLATPGGVAACWGVGTVHRVLPSRLQKAEQSEWLRTIVDSSSVHAMTGRIARGDTHAGQRSRYKPTRSPRSLSSRRFPADRGGLGNARIVSKATTPMTPPRPVRFRHYARSGQTAHCAWQRTRLDALGHRALDRVVAPIPAFDDTPTSDCISFPKLSSPPFRDLLAPP